MKAGTKKIDWIHGLKAFTIIGIQLNHFMELYWRGPII